VEAFLEIFGSTFEAIFEWRKDRPERKAAKAEASQLSYQVGGRDAPSQDGDRPSMSVGTSSRRGARQ
jgi:ferric-dicitrate binding protein FerR (iron transport regulator)